MSFLKSLFGRNKPQMPEVLYFKDNRSAFEYQCKLMVCKMGQGITLPALVTKVDPRSDKGQACAILLASDEGGIAVPFCTTLNVQVPVLAVGDLVAYHMAEYREDVPSIFLRQVGFIVAKLEPSLSLVKGWKKAT